MSKPETERADRAEVAVGTLQTALRQQWQPIATAPKDGRLILAYPASCWCEDSGDCEVIYWDTDTEEWGRVNNTVAEDYTGPTHWMPLPPKPSALLPALEPTP